MPQAPGFVFMVVDNRGAPAGQPLPNGHAAPAMIEAQSIDADWVEAADE
jgi:hypothetical protein